MATNIKFDLDEALVSRIKRFVPAHELNEWVHETVIARLTELEHVERENLMREGYIARQREDQHVYTDW
jgi:hypothetical protein